MLISGRTSWLVLFGYTYVCYKINFLNGIRTTIILCDFRYSQIGNVILNFVQTSSRYLVKFIAFKGHKKESQRFPL